MKLTALLALVCLWLACSPSLPEEVKQAYEHLPSRIDFNRHIKPILSVRCFACHGPDKNKLKAGLRLDLAASAYGELPENPGSRAIVPDNAGKSELVRRILSTDPEYCMPEPESHLTLNDHEKALLVKWVEQGAEYKPHWAFLKPVMPVMPEAMDARRFINPIDLFIQQRLREEAFKRADEADKEILLRRLSLDLTGLPPTSAEMDAFLADQSANAYELQVNRLLASPHFGERMAVDWMDVARFADSHGYTVDRLRDMSPWRDWVIDTYGDPEINTRIAQYEMAYRMQTSIPEVMDLSNEPDYIFDLYGKDSRDPGTFAANCLMARRLLEKDVKFVQLYHQGWDQHSSLPSGLKTQCVNTDQATAALIKDLKQRGLLEDTLLIWGGEFGRTVYSQGKLSADNYGRDHHPSCFTMFMAGAGVKPGFTYGETDDFGYNIVRDPVHVHDFQATLLHLLGIDHEKLTYKFQGRRFRLADVSGEVVRSILT